MESNQSDLSNLKPGDRVLMKTLQQAMADDLCVAEWLHIREFFGTVLTVDEVTTNWFFATETDEIGFKKSWIARILPREPTEEQRPTGLSSAWTDTGDFYSESEQTEPDTAGPVTVGVDLAAGESYSMNWYNPATHRLVPVEHYVGPPELGGVPDDAVWLLCGRSMYHVVTTMQLRFMDVLEKESIAWHVGPILPPESKDGEGQG